MCTKFIKIKTLFFKKITFKETIIFKETKFKHKKLTAFRRYEFAHELEVLPFEQIFYRKNDN